MVASPGTKGDFGRAGKIPGPRPTFSHPPGTKGARFPSFPPNLMFIFVYFYFSFKIGFHLLIQLKNYDSKNYGTKFLISI